MAHPQLHSKSSAKKFGGEWGDYIKIHNFFDQTKAHCGDCRHRMILHNTFGIFLAEQVFGVVFKRESDGKEIPTRIIAEQHILQDFGYIPTLNDVIDTIELKSWMCKGSVQLSKEFDKLEEKDDELPKDRSSRI